MIRFPALVAALAALTLVAVPTGSASHSFPADVPDSHPFHTEIGIFKDTNITVGCSATAFCPADDVRRQAMAAFIDRALGLLIRPGESTQKGVPGSRVEMLDDDLSFVGTEGNALRYRGPDNNVVGGATGNFVSPGRSSGTVAGGFENGVTDFYGSIGGGFGNQAGLTATVPGGDFNTASGAYSFAAGHRAKALYDGSFVWADGNAFDFANQGANSFSARTTGGVAFVTGIDGAGAPSAGVYVPSGSGSWASVSDRKAKRDFKAVDGAGILRRLAGVPVTTWGYKAQERSVRHIGPTAQDFRRAFRVGEDARRISTVDADGVALAAIKALHAEVKSLQRQNAALAVRVEALER